VDPALIDLLARGGAFTLLAVMVVGLLRGWVVPGDRYRKMEQERDEWKSLAVELMQTAQKAIRLVE
jgi:hypothetical protein